MDKLWIVLMLIVYFTGLYFMAKCTVEIFRIIAGAFKK